VTAAFVKSVPTPFGAWQNRVMSCFVHHFRFGGPLRVLAGATLVVLGACSASWAQAQIQLPGASPKALELKQQREDDLRKLDEQLRQVQAENQRLGSEIVQLRGDRARLTRELIDASRRVQESEQVLAGSEKRLQTLISQEAAFRRSLEARRETIAEVLASLQRLGRKPPPAVLVRPEDIMQTIRTSMLLGAVVPELRQEAEVILNDLTALVATREAVTAERDRQAAVDATLKAERERVTLLESARQKQLEASEARIVEERRKIQILARDAQSLKDLITRMENEITSANKAAQAASAVPLPQQNPAATAQRATEASLDFARLQPKVAFQDARSTLPLPVNGPIIRPFGSSDGVGVRDSGITVETGKHALVVAPADSWVSYAGDYRSFGQVLILNAGGGYRIILTGLSRVTVETGQFILSGEPVGAMGDMAAPALQREQDKGLPLLYIEFRKDGTPIDPGPWWAKTDGEKVRG
jgi:murein hydrolase activator